MGSGTDDGRPAWEGWERVVSESWTLETLKTHFDGLREADQKAVNTALASAKEAVQAALTASEKAILKAENAADKRAEASNEIRAAMIDQQKNFSNKAQTDLQFAAVTQRLEVIEKASASDRGKSAGFGQLAGIITIIIAAVGSLLGMFFLIRGAAQ